MRCRGFDGRFQCLHQFRANAADVSAFLLLAGLTAALVYWDILG